MRYLTRFILALFLPLATAWGADTTPSIEGYGIMKVNHELIDAHGNTQDNIGNLVDKAKYQAKLKGSPEVTGVRFFIHWKAPTDVKNIKVQVEARGLDAGTQKEETLVLTQTYPQASMVGEWTRLDLAGESFKKFGKLMAWRVSLWRGNEKKSSRHSFTWDDSYAANTQLLTPNPIPKNGIK